MIKGISHIGIAVKDLEKAIGFFEQVYSAKLLWRITYADEKIETAFMAVGDSRFELTSSLEAGSPIAKFVEGRGEGIHHVSLEVDEFDAVIDHFRGKGLGVISEVNSEDFMAAFIHPANNVGMLVEIVMPKRDMDIWAKVRATSIPYA